MSWDEYDKETQEKVKEKLQPHIAQMCKDGHDRDYCVKITGAPYEVVDAHYKRIEKARRENRGQSGPRPDEED